MTAMGCTEVRSAAGELALDMLGGEERAAALAHLENCASCRREVAALTDAAEELLVLAPDAWPSPGFEQRVVARIASLAASESGRMGTRTPGRPRSTPRRLLAVAAAVIVVVTVTAGAFIALRPDVHEAAAAQTSDMQTDTGHVVGTVSLAADPATIALTIPDWAGLVQRYGATVDGPYWLAVQTGDGARDLYRLPPADEQPWTVDIETDPSVVVAVSVVDNNGIVWCTAQFASR